MSGQQLPERLLDAVAAAQAGWLLYSAEDAAAEARAKGAVLKVMATAEGERGMVDLYVSLACLPGALLHALGLDPPATLASVLEGK